MSANSITASTQSVPSVASTEVAERADAITVQKTSDLSLEIFQELMEAFGVYSLADYNVTQWTDGRSIVFLGENGFGDEFYLAVTIEGAPAEEAESTLVIEEIEEEPAGEVVLVDPVIPELIPIAS